VNRARIGLFIPAKQGGMSFVNRKSDLADRRHSGFIFKVAVRIRE